MSPVNTSWDPGYVVFSYILSFIGSFVAVSLSEQFRSSLLDEFSFIPSSVLKILMSISFGVIAIWGMHFVGMGALIIKEAGTNEIIPVEFDLFLTFISLVSAVICVYAGITVSTNDRVFTRNSSGFDAMIISDASLLTLREARSKLRIRCLALFKDLRPIVLGGFVTGGGICVMHYVGMMAQIFTLSMKWNPGIIAISIIIAVLVSTVAFWIMFRLLPMFPSSDMLRVVSASIMGGAVCGMHYTGMHAATFTTTTKRNNILSIAIASKVAVLSASTISLIVIGILIMCLQAESRERQRKLVRILQSLNKDTETTASTNKRMSVLTLHSLSPRKIPLANSSPSTRRWSGGSAILPLRDDEKKMETASRRNLSKYSPHIMQNAEYCPPEIVRSDRVDSGIPIIESKLSRGSSLTATTHRNDSASRLFELNNNKPQHWKIESFCPVDCSVCVSEEQS